MQRVARILITIADDDIAEYRESYPELSEEEAFEAIATDELNGVICDTPHCSCGTHFEFIEYEKEPATDEDV